MNKIQAGLQPAACAGRHLILYDGLCGLCSRLTGFVLARDRKGVFDFVSQQGTCGRSIMSRYGRDPDALSTFYIVTDYRSNSPALLCGATAVLFLLNTIGGSWRLVALLGFLPRRLLDCGYDLIARNRYFLFGRLERCLLPDPESKSHFIDLQG